MMSADEAVVCELLREERMRVAREVKERVGVLRDQHSWSVAQERESYDIRQRSLNERIAKYERLMDLTQRHYDDSRTARENAKGGDWSCNHSLAAEWFSFQENDLELGRFVNAIQSRAMMKAASLPDAFANARSFSSNPSLKEVIDCLPRHERIRVYFIGLRNVVEGSRGVVSDCRRQLDTNQSAFELRIREIEEKYIKDRKDFIRARAKDLVVLLNGFCDDLCYKQEIDRLVKCDDVGPQLLLAIADSANAAEIYRGISARYGYDDVVYELTSLVEEGFVGASDALRLRMLAEKLPETVEVDDAPMLSVGDKRLRYLFRVVSPVFARAIWRENGMNLGSFSDSDFGVYVSLLTEVVTDLKDSGRIKGLNPLSDPKRFASFDELGNVQAEMSVEEDYSEGLSSRLTGAGFDPVYLRALVLGGFKVKTRRFIGGHGLGFDSLWNNTRAALRRAPDDLKERLGGLVKEGVVLECNGRYSLNSNLDGISNPVLREAVSWYLSSSTSR